MTYRDLYEPRALTWWDIEPYLPEDFEHLITIRGEVPSVDPNQLTAAMQKSKASLVNDRIIT